TMLMNVCFADDQSKKEVAQAQKEAENARDRANKSGIELEQEKKEAENARDRANKSGIELEQEKQKTIKTQKDFIKDLEQNCKENHGQFFIEKGGTKAGIGGITIEAEAKCKTPKPTKTNQTPIQS
ncbi:DUF874 family protein, partial [Helicobacter pylori]|uniref:DUF874 family protein n=1 Tax=Helicobacter pylori TaxID=210 RepID=UPI001BB35AFD